MHEIKELVYFLLPKDGVEMKLQKEAWKRGDIIGLMSLKTM